MDHRSSVRGVGAKMRSLRSISDGNRVLRPFLGCQKGNVAIIFGMVAIPVVLSVGIAVDYARALSARTKLQGAVDAAAMAGARLPATSNQNRMHAANQTFAVNLTNSGLPTSIQPTIEANNAEVKVAAAYLQPAAFTGLMGLDSIQVGAETTARSQVENGGVVCLLALNPTASDGLHLQGINKLSEENCWAWVNSTSPTALNATGTSLGKAQGFCTAGDVLGAEHFSPPPYTGCEPMEDPFAEKFAAYDPPDGDCTSRNTNVQLKSGTFTLKPGVYCGDLVLKPQANVTFEPGIYVIKDGYFEIQGQASAAGDGVVFFFKGSNTRLIVRGGGNIDFKAPAMGDLAGFVLVDRLWGSNATINETVIQGGGRVKIEGILYAPQWRVNISGNGDVNQEANYLAMIADHFYMEGNGKLYIRSDAASAGLPDLMPKIATGPLLLQ
jgi:Flp pilus assembly protein TadG